jgi:hypothetical protein
MLKHESLGSSPTDHLWHVHPCCQSGVGGRSAKWRHRANHFNGGHPSFDGDECVQAVGGSQYAADQSLARPARPASRDYGFFIRRSAISFELTKATRCGRSSWRDQRLQCSVCRHSRSARELTVAAPLRSFGHPGDCGTNDRSQGYC